MPRQNQANLAENAYLALKNQILTLGFLPGESLLEERLQETLKVSRTPIRMALSRLGQEGLVSHLPGRGFFVCDIRVQEVVNLFQVREFLEVPAARLAARNASDEELKEFKRFADALSQALKTGAQETYHRQSVEFHYRITALSRNGLLCDLVRSLNEKLSIVTRILSKSESRLFEATREHDAIADHLLARDGEAAAELLRRHIVESGQGFLSVLQRRTELLSISPPPASAAGA